MNTPFEPAAYKDEYQVKLRELMNLKYKEKKLLSASEPASNVINLMDALKASIDSKIKIKQKKN